MKFRSWDTFSIYKLHLKKTCFYWPETKKSSYKPPDTKTPSAPSSSSLNESSSKYSKDDTDGKLSQKKVENTGTSRTAPQGKDSYRGGSQGNHDSHRGYNDDSHRGSQQSIPPRFAKLGRGDGQRNRNDSGGYRGGGRYDSGNLDNQGGYQNRQKENQGQRGQKFAGDSQDAKALSYPQSNKGTSSQNEIRTYNDQRNSEYKKRNPDQVGDFSRNNFSEQRKNGGSYSNNMSFSQANNSERNPGQSGSRESQSYDRAVPVGNQQNNKPYSQQAPFIPNSYPQDSQFNSMPGKQSFEGQQVHFHI